MKAVYLPGNRKVEIRSVAIPVPGPDEVLIEVKASCICRSDLSLYYGNAVVGGDAAGGCITGHEPSGVVVETGVAVKNFKRGDRVAVYLAVGCGVCARCRQGNFHLCPTWTCLGFTQDGGNAEYLAVPERNLLRIPASMSFVAAAISTDAFGTLYSACRKLGLSGASTVGIWGLGPMGSAGILAAKALGARVVALDPIAERRHFADELGADLTLDPTDVDAAAAIATFSGGDGLSAAIDCSGNGAAQNMALDSLAPLGRAAFVGESRETTIRPSDQLIRKQISLIGSWYFGISEYEEIIRTIETHKIDLERLATHRFSIDEAETAFRLFDERKTEKAVFVF
ncbi:alcohol dehydrogenase catalytic domain-containing protein [Mesorhizobium sp. BR1-1-16]|uniref:zinc-binding dehydrogenase n=1 Tax=Mesorhizobium sp. BR1-1-16 TaxID=2876653 RepID=UPI001CCCC86A|nr:alcohol dehydrogenase catalytic domain-containing protein [Mesorhizobium sp. BR1-1-16]MBZ9938955.1 alcohol dehydrogenase catalytic domain-containing protein [Mesorhizobium sp. BR1-1-16]